MKLFGEFLVESKAISEEQLLESLLSQLKMTPPIGVIVFENKLLSNTEILQIFSLQAKNKLGFIDSAKKLGFWNNISEAVESKVSQSRPPIGQIFAKNKILPIEELSRLLDEYLDTLTADEIAQATSELNGLSQERRVQNFAPFLEAYSEGIQDSFLNNIQLLNMWPDMSETERSNLTEFFENRFHLFKRVLKVLKLSSEEELFSEMELLFREIFKEMDHFDMLKIQQVQTSMGNLISSFWLLRENLSEGLVNSDIINILKQEKEDLRKSLAMSSSE
ncbi:MAG: hypothetical protein ACXVB1_02225 [Pseudobdellovibrionaceae bacterium]